MYHIDPLQPRREQSTQYMGELLAGRRSAVLPRHAPGRRINVYVNLSICVVLWSRLNNSVIRFPLNRDILIHHDFYMKTPAGYPGSIKVIEIEFSRLNEIIQK